MSLDQDLLNLKAKRDQLNTLKIQNATKLSALEEEKNKLLAEAAELGIDPQKIEETLKLEEAAVQKQVTDLDSELTRILDEIGKL